MFAPGPASTTTSTITALPTSITANGISTSAVTVRLRDAFGNALTGSGGVVALTTSAGTLGAVADNGNGTYTASLRSGTTPTNAAIHGTLNGVAIADTEVVQFVPPVPSTATTTISAAPGSIVANGSSTATITVQAKDASGNNIVIGGATVTLSTTAGSLGPVTDHNNGTYTATLTSGTIVQTDTVRGTLNGSAIVDTATVKFIPGIASPATSTIVAAPSSIVADGISTAALTVRLKDAFGNNLTTGGAAVALSTTAGTLNAVTDNGNGTYSASLKSGITPTIATVRGTVNSAAIADTELVTFAAPVASPVTSRITASPTSIVADGQGTSTITVQLKDAGGNNLTVSGGSVSLATTAGALGAVTDNGNGTYTAVLTSGTVQASAVVSGILNGTAMTSTATVSMSPPAGNWYDFAWGYRRSFQVDNPTGSDLTGYQVCLTLGSSFDFGKALSDGSDIRVTDADGITAIPFWVERWNPAGTQASIWVKVPYISPSGTEVFVYYGNPSPVLPPSGPTDVPPTGPFARAVGNPIVPVGGPANGAGLLAENIVFDSATGHYWLVCSNYGTTAGVALVWSDSPTNPGSWNWYGNIVDVDGSLGPHLIQHNGTWYLFYAAPAALSSIAHLRPLPDHTLLRSAFSPRPNSGKRFESMSRTCFAVTTGNGS